MPGPDDADIEFRLLTTAPGRALLDAVAAVAAPVPADLVRWRKAAPADDVAAAMRLVAARRRGRAKFADADAMWLHPTGVEQATAAAVARHKARRFAGAAVVADLCCGVGGDARELARVAGGFVLAVDRDAGMARRTRWNAAAAGVAGRLLAVRADAARAPLPGGALLHVDPDRRARPGGRRARLVDDYAPGLGALRRLMEVAPGGAIKLGPASDFAASFDRPGLEVELISLDGECKEATVWFGALAGPDASRRATVLPAVASWTDRDGPRDAPGRTAPAGAFLFDPDPALSRSGLLDGFAATHGLARLAPGLNLLSGPAPLASPFGRAFAVEQALPLDRKRLRRLVHDRGLGPLEIKVFGLEVRPEAIRRELGPPGDRPATLILVGGPGAARAFLARRLDAAP
jgi:SAM-dependent methyltransferase